MDRANQEPLISIPPGTAGGISPRRYVFSNIERLSYLNSPENSRSSLLGSQLIFVPGEKISFNHVLEDLFTACILWIVEPECIRTDPAGPTSGTSLNPFCFTYSLDIAPIGTVGSKCVEGNVRVWHVSSETSVNKICGSISLGVSICQYSGKPDVGKPLELGGELC